MTLTGIETPMDVVEEEREEPSLGQQLLAWARASSPVDVAAVQALVDEERILARDDFRRALVVDTGGVLGCDWEGLSGRRYVLPLDTGERAFVDLVLSLAGPCQVNLARTLMELDDRRIAILLRAMALRAGSDRIAIGTYA